jgi:putative N6-adenine-specific DNA methylase
MEVSRNASRIIITCINRLTPWLVREVEELGFKPIRSFATGTELKGTVNDCIRLNLNLLCASQVLYLLREFKAHDIQTIYREVKAFPWENVIRADGYFSVTSNVDHPSINNNMYVNVRVKDAVADRFRERTGRRPDSGSEPEGVVIHLYWKDNVAALYLDTSGPSLARHGYRKNPGEAPMLEALAAATVMATSWDRKSPFINPMCGSGTIIIEAAMLATNRKPGLLRSSYAFMHLVGYDVAFYERELDAMRRQIRDEDIPALMASDIRPEAIAEARDNARRAGVGHLIRFEVCSFDDIAIPSGNSGVIFLNPPYGERMGEMEELEKLYKRIGDFLKKKCTGYTGYVFTGNLDLAKKVGLKASRRIEFYSARLDCRLLEYKMY